MPFDPPLAPQTRGMRLLVDAAAATPVLDVTLPGGAYDAVSRRGWRVNAAGTKWIFPQHDRGRGITKVGLVRRRTPVGLVRLAVTGKRGAWAMPAALPLGAVVVLDPPTATTGQCGTAVFPGPPPSPSCAADAAAGKVGSR